MKPTSSKKAAWLPILRRRYPSGKTAWQISVMLQGKRIRGDIQS